MTTHGAFIGRFQPLHLGHQSVISNIFADGLKPIIIIGSPTAHDAKNPYSLSDRFGMIGSVYGDAVHITYATDNPNNEIWAAGVLESIEFFCPVSSTMLYYHFKDEDIKPEYYGKHYVDLLEGKIGIKESHYAKQLGLDVSATAIRDDYKANQHYVDGRIHRYIKL